MSGPLKTSSAFSIKWVLRGLVGAGLSIMLLIDLYHTIPGSSIGIPIWMLPFVPFMFLMGPVSILLMLVEIVMTLKNGLRKSPLLIDAGLVTTYLVLWFAHL